MKKNNKKRQAEINQVIDADADADADGDEELWDKRKLGDDLKHTKAAPSGFTKQDKSVATSIRMPLKMIDELKKIAERDGLPYKTLIKSILTKFIREQGGGDAA